MRSALIARRGRKKSDRGVLAIWPCTFYRRSGESLEPAGGKDLKTSEVLVLGEDAVHAIANPLDQTSYAIHVYGGDLPGAKRSMWNPFSLKEEPCEYEGLMRYARQLMGKEEPAAYS